MAKGKGKKDSKAQELTDTENEPKRRGLAWIGGPDEDQGL